MILKIVFWLSVAYIPMALDYETTEFMANQCMVGSECLKLTMPLIVQIGIVGWGARALLWPLAAWHLGGAWLCQKYIYSRLPKVNING